MTLDCAAEPILRPMYHAAPLGLLAAWKRGDRQVSTRWLVPSWICLLNGFCSTKVTFLSNLILSFGVLNILFAIMARGSLGCGIFEERRTTMTDPIKPVDMGLGLVI